MKIHQLKEGIKIVQEIEKTDEILKNLPEKDARIREYREKMLELLAHPDILKVAYLASKEFLETRKKVLADKFQNL